MARRAANSFPLVPKGTSLTSIASETAVSKSQRPTSTRRTSAAQRRRPTKPAKPKGFPLTPNVNGQWSKKINGKVYYFGTWDDPDGALKRYLEVAQNLKEGRPARSEESDRLTVRDLANEFLTFKQHMVNTGEIARRTFDEYRDTCERLIRVLGRDMPVERIQAGDLRKVREDIAKHGVSIKTLANEIGRKQVGFYALRHTFETVAGQTRDQVAVNAMMGHIDDSMAENYRHGIDDERLRAVVDHVHAWLFGTGEQDDAQVTDREDDQVADQEDDE